MKKHFSFLGTGELKVQAPASDVSWLLLEAGMVQSNPWWHKAVKEEGRSWKLTFSPALIRTLINPTPEN